MLQFIFVIILTAVVIGLGWPAINKLDSSCRLNNGERLLLSFGVGCFVIYFGVSTIGHFSFDAASMWVFFGLCTLASIFGWLGMPRAKFLNVVLKELTIIRNDRWLLVLWGTTILVGLSSLIQGLAPPNDYDSLLYHLSLPQYELEYGRLGVPWDRKVLNMFFPKMAGDFTRLSLATMGPEAAQMMLGMFGLIAAGATAAIVCRLGLSKYAALVSCIFFLSIRAVIWEMATVEVDVALAAFCCLGVLAYVNWRENGNVGLGILFGLMIGASILVKLYGFAVAISFAPVMLYDLWQRRIRFAPMSVAPLVAFSVIIPHLINMYVLTGNPLFPAVNHLFNPGKPIYFADAINAFGTGRGLFDLVLGPWYIFVSPMEYFDGMIFGAPYLLALCPLLLVSRDRKRVWLPTISVAVAYYCAWFFIGAQQVRFLIAIAPLLSALAAAGAFAMWKQTARLFIWRSAFISILVILGINQAMFVAIYAGLRLPVALGIMSEETYHEKTPTMNGAFFKTCNFLRQNLKAGETYYSLAGPHSYYCPQVSVTPKYFADEAKWWLDSDVPPKMPIEEFIRRSERANFRYFMFVHTVQNRRNITARTTFENLEEIEMRFGKYIKPVMTKLEPLVAGPYTAVYDGPKFIAELKARHGRREP